MVDSDDRARPPSLAAKVDRLFQTIHPPASGEFSHEHVASAIRDSGGPTISAQYIWQLRRGIRDNPTKKHLEALAAFFNVPPAYFFDDEAAERIDAQLELLATMRDSQVRAVAVRAAGLSIQSLAAVQSVIENARRLEGLPPPSRDADGSDPPARGL